MMKGLVVDETMSNLTSASSEVSANNTGSLYPQHSSTSTNQELPQPKKKRSLPGHPDPGAEVVALSPKTLLATNRFICEICNKGFKRDQNLQLHRRGHNLPWKLKQRNSKEIIRKKVYVCPEATCVHHDPSRALGDLTGIKKHFCRKHGEKKWKCEKCSKRYAVQSDWKAHSKICGTREYKCDCGTLFSRRDSFITHRAFCDVLAQESARANITPINPLLSSHTTQLHNHHTLQTLSIKREQDHQFNLRQDNNIPPWFSFPPQNPTIGEQTVHGKTQPFDLSNPNFSTMLPSFQSLNPSPHMSATALLQKASQIASSSSVMHSCEDHHIGTSFAHGMESSGYLEDAQQYSLFNDMILGSTTNTVHGSSFEEGMNMRGMFNAERDNNNYEEFVSKSTQSLYSKSNNNNNKDSTTSGAGGVNNEMTRDFLGLRAISQRDFFSVSGMDHVGNSSSYNSKQSHNQFPWQG